MSTEAVASLRVMLQDILASLDPPKMPAPRPQFYVIVEPFDPTGPSGHNKTVDSAPGVIMVFEDRYKATAHAAALTTDPARPYRVIAVAAQFLGPIIEEFVDAEFVDDDAEEAK